MIYRFLTQCFEPYTLLVLITAIGLSHLWRRERQNRRRLLWAVVPFSGLLLISMPLVSHLAFATLEWQTPHLGQLPADADVIVVLSGGLLPVSPSRPAALLSQDTMSRLEHAATIFRKARDCGHAMPIVVTGGQVYPRVQAPPLAHLMRDYLCRLGVPADKILIEDRSRSTYENARETWQILQKLGVDRIVLVTEAYHMPRSMRCFKSQGLHVIPAACDFRTDDELAATSWLPTPSSAREVNLVAHEWVGLIWYRLMRRI
jgi:uncharacterized SAM-binding protein YcdF (DUF218 family)